MDDQTPTRPTPDLLAVVVAALAFWITYYLLSALFG